MLKCENLPRTNSTKYETINILAKFQQNEHTPAMLRYVVGNKQLVSSRMVDMVRVIQSEADRIPVRRISVCLIQTIDTSFYLNVGFLCYSP